MDDKTRIELADITVELKKRMVGGICSHRGAELQWGRRRNICRCHVAAGRRDIPGRNEYR